jgi:hypothetical protein
MNHTVRHRRRGSAPPGRVLDAQEAVRRQVLSSVRARLQSADTVLEATYRDLLCDGGLRPLTQLIDAQRRELADLIDLLEPTEEAAATAPGCQAA